MPVSHTAVSINFDELEKRAEAHMLEGDGRYDLHTHYAAELLGCDPGEVTPTGRRAARALQFHTMYSGRIE